jgi:hypothetical protein
MYGKLKWTGKEALAANVKELKALPWWDCRKKRRTL